MGEPVEYISRPCGNKGRPRCTVLCTISTIEHEEIKLLSLLHCGRQDGLVEL